MSSGATSAMMSTPPKPQSFWPHDLVLGLLPLLLGFHVLLWFTYLPLGQQGFADFRQLYAGGYMIRTGHAGSLYDYEAQQRFEEALTPTPTHFMLPINHPAFEELLFVPLSLLTYRSAYWTFMSFNVGLLVICLRLLRPRLNLLYGRWRWFPVLLLAAFNPISRALLQGQDSIIMLTLLVVTLVSLDHGNEAIAGLILGIGVFKFQIAIPIALLFLLWRRWRFCLGFAISSSIAAGISLLIVGLHGAKAYEQSLISMSVRLSSNLDMLRYATFPVDMLNLRGLVSGMLAGKASPFWLQAVIFAASGAILFVAARKQPSLPLAITASALVSYHFLPHDASVLFLPAAIALCGRSVWPAATAALFVIVSMCATLPRYGYLAAIPLLAFFIVTATKAGDRANTGSLSQHASS
jgi:Glycosyltransferase family 87